ncbi:MAG: translation initiation factor IF-2 [Clostridiales bacterium]|nr:translation initiation factor IF-2 [Clostridiales bacterium]
MINKIKLQSLSKDLKVKNSEIADILSKFYGGEAKKASAVLENEELDVIFEKITKDSEVAELDTYFAMTEGKQEPPKGKEEADKAETQAQKKDEAASQVQPQPDNQQKAENKDENIEGKNTGKNAAQPEKKEGNHNKDGRQAANDRNNAPKNDGRKPDNRSNNNNNNNKNSRLDAGNRNNGKQGDSRNDGGKSGDARAANQNRGNRQNDRPNNDRQNNNRNDANRQSKQPRMPQMPTAAAKADNSNQNSGSKPLQRRTKGEQTVINLRANDVDLEKYNEKYETLSLANKTQGRDNGPQKQKINQKSKQYKKQGMRSSKRETEAERLKRIAAERAKKPQLLLKLPEEITVGELASMLKMTAAEVIKKLFALGQMASINDNLDYETAAIVAEELGAKVEKQVVVTIEDRIIDDSEDREEDLVKRDPVVVVMGHVDHGKTSILDAIRNTSVTSTEAGGITQHIGAYRTEINGNKITFLDTPGHAAFTSMRLRGAMATDIAVLVVAADDGIMPQTIEAINHAKAAGVQIIVAINKIDKPAADPDKVKQQLTEHEIVPEEWGGDAICVPVSAKTGQGIDSLLESIILVAEMQELKANPNRNAKGVVIEARLDKGRGPVSTLLVQNGTLNSGDIIVAGTAVGRVRVMTDDKGRRVKTAGPSVPVEIMGLDEVPQAGDGFDAVKDEKLARELVEQRKNSAKEAQFKEYQKVTLENLFDSIKDGELKELNIIIKADVQGSAEAVKQSLVKLSNEEVRVKIVHSGVGAISESDVMLANVSNAIIVGFNVRPDNVAAETAERDGVQLKMYRVIYDCINEISDAIKGMLAPKFREAEQGKAEVRQIVKISSVGNVAGCRVTSGLVTRNSKIRVVRDGIVVADDEIASLRRFKDDVKEVQNGYECGIALAKFNDFKEGDVFEAYIIEEYREN